MKSKHVILCLIGFIVFVHAHYFNSWINYYDAPVHPQKGLTDLKDQDKTGKENNTGNSVRDSRTKTDSVVFHFTDTPIINTMKFDSSMFIVNE